MITFKNSLEQRLNDIIQPLVGPGSDPINFVKTFDDHLHDVEFDELPFVVIAVRTKEKFLPGEIGVPFQKYTWTSHIYYLDMETDTGNYSVAKSKRDIIVAKIEKALEQHRLMNLNLTGSNSGPLTDTDSDGHTERVFDSSIQAEVFDQSGQEERYSFTNELYLEVYTDRY